MRKEDLINQRAVEIARALMYTTEILRKENGKPFVPGWQDKVEDLMPLIENIIELYKHPRKNAEILYFLNEFASSFYR